MIYKAFCPCKCFKCICFFGGSPEPQLPYAIRVARRIVAESQMRGRGQRRHIIGDLWSGRCFRNRIASESNRRCLHPNPARQRRGHLADPPQR